ncbi:MAG: hypothetical protein QME12_06535 [Nanoarchaeota archaeon]|nr:hypothetical protein [Nanoarchaeota archaeon]
MKPWLPLFGLLPLLSGCVMMTAKMASPPKVVVTTETMAVDDICIKACKEAIIPLDNGPCLLNPIANSGWVCDVAHIPRRDIDNIAENQCSAFREGKASHFVEVSPDCKLINKV